MSKKICFSLILGFLLILAIIQPKCMAAYPVSGDWEYYVVDFNNRVFIIKYHGSAENVTIPATLGGKAVTDIAVSAFENNKTIKSISMPDTIYGISGRAFFGCSNLEKVKLSNNKNYDRFGECIFQDCTSLKEIELPDGIACLNNRTFQGCTNLVKVKLPKELEAISASSFEGCTSLESIVIPESVKYIMEYAFKDCTSLKNINMPNELINMGQFTNCTSLKEITIPEKVNGIGLDEFENCTSLEKVTILSRTLYIGDPSRDHTFLNCSKNLTIYAYKGSTAEAYAKKNGYNFVELKGFKDVKPSDWYYQAVDFCSSNGIITGMADGGFAPDVELSRAMLVSILYKMEGQPKVTANVKFPDVKQGAWYYNAVAWASKNNLVSGYNDGRFAPDESIKREDLAAILKKYATYKGKNTNQTNDLSEFSDVNTISSYAVNNIKWAVGAGVITGNNKNGVKTINPKGKSSRAEAAAMIEKYCKQIGR